MLLDYQLGRWAPTRTQIQGYEREEYTHLAVAAAVAGGVGRRRPGHPGRRPRAEPDFVPLLKERYDLVIPREFYESDLLRPLLDLIRGPEFRQQVEALGGYDASQMGEVVAEI